MTNLITQEMRDAFRKALRPCAKHFRQGWATSQAGYCDDCLDLALVAVAASGSPPSPAPEGFEWYTVLLPNTEEDANDSFLENEILDREEIKAVLRRNGWLDGRQNNVHDALLIGSARMVHDVVIEKLRARASSGSTVAPLAQPTPSATDEET